MGLSQVAEGQASKISRFSEHKILGLESNLKCNFRVNFLWMHYIKVEVNQIGKIEKLRYLDSQKF